MSDRILDHHRRQLSALMDGALAPDQARFLLRRLRHDRELADTWERWQIVGEALRGRQARLLPGDFAVRVQARIAAAGPVLAAAPQARRRWRALAGMAAAVSLAAVALWLARPAGEGAGGTAAPTVAGRALAPGPAAGDVPQPAVTTPQAPPAAQPRRAVAVNAARPEREAPSRPRVTPTPLPRGPVSSAVAVAPPADVAPVSPQPHDPFALGAQPVASRPWPRAALPRFGGANGTYAAGFGVPEGAPQDPVMLDPFTPRFPQQPVEDDATGTPR